MIRECSWEASGAADDQERLCEAGVFVLTPAGWALASRRRFTQIGAARQWAKAEAGSLRQLFVECHWRIITDGDMGTLEDVLAVFEVTRYAEGTELGELLTGEDERDAATKEQPQEDDQCEACVCVEVEAEGKRTVLIAARKTLANGVEAARWARFAEGEMLQCSDVQACATVILQRPSTDGEVLAEFRKRVVRRGGRG